MEDKSICIKDMFWERAILHLSIQSKKDLKEIYIYKDDEKYLYYVSCTRSQHHLIIYNN